MFGNDRSLCLKQQTRLKFRRVKCARPGFSVKCFQRIDSGSNDIEVTIKEALHIKYSKPNLNKQFNKSGSSIVLNIF